MDEREFVRHQQQNIRREERHDEREERRDAAGDTKADAHDAVDALAVAAAPVLADEHARPALQSEDDELDDEDGHIRYRDGGHLLAAEQTDHEGIEKAERGGDEILHDDGQGEQKEASVEALGLTEIGEHNKPQRS